MLQFPKEYFDVEKRDDFCISELMKRAWAAQLEVLQRIIEICEKYNLTYYAYWGTLLGAIRHHGFIPWDDDMDIVLKRDDYIRFLEVAASELPENYCILNAYTEDEYENSFSRITNGHEIDFSENRLSQYHGCPFVVGIDVYPFYYVPRDPGLAEQQKQLLNLIGLLTSLLDYKTQQEETGGNAAIIQECSMQIAEGLVSVEKLTGYHFAGNKSLKGQLEIVYDQICRLAGEEESDYLTCFPKYMVNGYQFKKELMNKTLKMPFENIMINVPDGYDEILRRTYNEYMVPVKKRGAHDYPFYKEQLHLLGQHIEKNYLEQQRVFQWRQPGSTDMRINNLSEEKLSEKDLPKDWRDRIYFTGKEGERKRKKVILYYTGADALLCNSEFVLEKLKDVLETFKKEPGIVLWWFPCPLDIPSMQFIKQMAPQLVRGYQQILEDYRRQDWGICDDTGDIERAVRFSDAYYGDESEISRLYQETGKWIMIQDYKIAGR